MAQRREPLAFSLTLLFCLFFVFFFFVLSLPFQVVRQRYDVRVDGKEVLLGNVALLRCFVPEHVKDYVSVTSWQRGDEQLLAELADMGKLKQTIYNSQFTR